MSSSYEPHTTYKVLVGISPNGYVGFIVDVYGERASDKLISLSSEKLLEAFEPGDAVMADRGFVIDNELKPHGVQLICPAFRGARHVLNCWGSNYAERAIGRINNFCILKK